MIYTFYSYKGGVGRSMALANVAEWFYQRGLRVIMIDWDLEAPGLESFFYSSEEQLDIVRSQLGLIDLLVAYKRAFPRLQSPLLEANSPGANGEKKANDFLETLRQNTSLPPVTDALYPIHPPDGPDGKGPALWLMPSGWRSGDRFPAYAQAVQSFDWSDFYASYQGETYFNWMREQLTAETLCDVVLIDSRTGVTEMGGVCTRQLADVVVSFCVPNAQNLGGVKTMAESFRREEIISQRGRGLDIVLIPTRIDLNELDARKRFEDQFRQLLDEFTPRTLKAVNAAFWDLQIQYVPKYAYYEGLAINDASAPELGNAYKKIAVHLALLAQGASGLQIRSAMSAELQAEFGDRLPSVFISAVDAEGQVIARELRERLTQQRVAIWPELSDLKGKADSWQQVTGILDQAKAMVLVMTPEAMRSDFARRQWRYARQQGVSVYLVARNADTLEVAVGSSEPGSSFSEGVPSRAEPSGMLPRWLSNENYYDVDREWEKLASVLQRPVLTTRVPFMAPDLPEGYVQRTKIFNELKSALLSYGDPTATLSLESVASDALSQSISDDVGSHCVALWGPLGSGKTALANSLCQDADVNSGFVDGIMWTTLGENPNILTELKKLYGALTGERPKFEDEEEAAHALSAKLMGKRCLLVINDVFNAEHLRFFAIPSQSQCAQLITTGDLNIAFGNNAQLFHVGEMSESESLSVISAHLNPSSETQPSFEKLARHLGYLPFALRLANKEIRKRTKLGNDLTMALESFGRDYDERGLLVLDSVSTAEGKVPISQNLESAIAKTLPVKADYDRFIQLAFFPKDEDITIKAVSDLWGVNESETETQIQHLRDVSLLEYDPAQKMIRLQNVMRSYLLSRMPDQEGLNDKLEAAFSHFSPVRQDAARRVLTRLVRLKLQGEDGDDACQRVKLGDLDNSSQIVVELLTEAKLVTVLPEQATGDSYVQIANEAYLKGWKRLRNWIDDDRDFLLWRQQLKLKILEWEDINRDQGALLSGIPLDIAIDWRNRRTDDLNAAEQSYIDESVAELDRVKQAEEHVSSSQRKTRLSAAAVVIFTFIVLILVALGVLQYVRQQRAEEARKKADEIARKLAEDYNSTGSLELADKRYDDAIHDFTEAIKAKPDYADAYLNRARAHAAGVKMDQAIADYSKALELKPDLAVAYFERADLYSQTGKDDDKAIADYTKALQYKPDYWDAYLNRGFTYESAKNLEAAIDDYTQIINSQAQQVKANAYLRRGFAYLSKNDKQHAIEDFKNTIKLSADPAIRDPAVQALKSLGSPNPPPQDQTPATPIVFLEYNDSKDGFVVDAISKKLQQDGLGFKVQPKDVSGGKTNGDVRYYYPEDKAAAEKIRKIVNATLAPYLVKFDVKLDITLIYLGKRYTYVPRGSIEVWIPQLQKSLPQFQMATPVQNSKKASKM